MTDPSIPAEYCITAECRRSLAEEIDRAKGNEVFFFGSLDEEGRLITVEVIARVTPGRCRSSSSAPAITTS